jgi:hypothetical protein
MTDTTYNGWTNKPTWAVKLWIDSDQGLQQYWLDRAGQAVSDTLPGEEEREAPRWKEAEYLLAEFLKEWAEEKQPEAFVEATMWGDLAQWALAHVEWREIAESLLEHWRGGVAS